MPIPPDPNELLDDILGEDFARDAQILDRTIKAVRQKRTFRIYKRAVAMVAATTVGVALILTRTSPPQNIHSDQHLNSAIRNISTTPLPSSMLVESRRGAVAIIDSGTLAENQIVITQHSQLLSVIGDDELLLLAKDQGGALVREPGASARLLFVATPNMESNVEQ
ncbi:MAG: hypothetical protein JNN07_19405 [Verrucomicrobiales bacterium]|nr:hypothetical protein [Verrucomicrobiales bacterium]